MTFSQVQWIGRFAKPENAFHEFVKKLYLHAYPAMLDGNEIMGATAWWNIRPSNPKPHNDRVSYCTVDGVDYSVTIPAPGEHIAHNGLTNNAICHLPP